MAIIQPINAGLALDTGRVPDTRRDQSVAAALQGLGGELRRSAEVAQRYHEMGRKRAAFAAEEQWQRLQGDLDALHADALKNAPPGAANFTADLGDASNKLYSSFLGTVPRELQSFFHERVELDRDLRLQRAAADEVKGRLSWTRSTIAGAVSAAGEDIAADPARYGTGRQAVYALIEQADLSPTEQENLRRDADVAL